ncbi:hypothetical protein PR202_ga29103 [Eleusine coracana subsp. coracana]|uniref:Uncharacterized protein n=1 Tax=Eleusine coracana subsp. coracana TaxID=191504 RepID=A0AAV5DK96_ELECO|nr:hypothetical protein PR202_ga29103 [Eleusine coracana subsp. coracana]
MSSLRAMSSLLHIYSSSAVAAGRGVSRLGLAPPLGGSFRVPLKGPSAFVLDDVATAAGSARRWASTRAASWDSEKSPYETLGMTLCYVWPVQASQAWMEWVMKKRKAFDKRGDMAVAAWAEQQHREMTLRARRLSRSKVDPEEERKLFAKEKKASMDFYSTTLRHTLVLRKRDIMRKKSEEDKNNEISRLLAAEGLELDTDEDDNKTFLNLWPLAPVPVAAGPKDNLAVLVLTATFAAAVSFVSIGLVYLMSAQRAVGSPITRCELSCIAIILWGSTVICFFYYVSAPSMLGVHSMEWMVVSAAAVLLLAATAFILCVPPKVTVV